MKARYERNLYALSEEEQEKLFQKKVCIVGCGGLGGYLLEYLLRAGVGCMTVIDGDCFEESNLNRQILSNEHNIGCSKVQAAREHAKAVNREVQINAVDTYLTEENAEELLKGHDLVLDAVDNMAARRILGHHCARLRIPLMYGAIKGWYAQVALVLPGSQMLDILCSSDVPLTDKSSLPFTPAACAAFQTAEAIKYLCGRDTDLNGKILYVDLLHMETEQIDLTSPLPDR